MTAVVILAAGSSSRFGSPKQNLVYNGVTLLQQAVKSALAVTNTVIVVLGANREQIEHTIKDEPVNILYNSSWQDGMATSIYLAVNEIQTVYLNITVALFILCDQPFADDILLQQLIDAANATDKGIIASAYNDTLGVPALFKQSYFPYLLALKSKEGARKLIGMHSDDVMPIPFDKGKVDIDTQADWEQLKQQRAL